MGKAKRTKHGGDVSSRQSNTAVVAGSTTIAKSDIESQFSQWALHPSKLHFYRARYISYEEASTIVQNERNSIVPTLAGQCIHYQFLGITEAAQNLHYSPPIMTSQTIAATSLGSEASSKVASQQQQQEQQQQQQQIQCAEDVGGDEETPAAAEKQVLDSSEGKEAVHTFNEPKVDMNAADGLAMVVAADAAAATTGHHHLGLNKKTRKRLQAEKKLRVSSTKKVHNWLISEPLGQDAL